MRRAWARAWRSSISGAAGPNEAAVMHIVGDVKDKVAIVVDDMVDTAGTLTKGGAAVKAAGRPVGVRDGHPRGVVRTRGERLA